MEAYKEDFITFMVRSNVLTFGDFTTKSGRKTPFFINTGNYDTGAKLAMLGRFYAMAFQNAFPDQVDVLFGPAYKGIPLVSAVSMALSGDYNRDIAFCFDRKEEKAHGEGGCLVGHALKDGESIVIVEDVTTAGTSIRTAVPLLMSCAAVQIKGLIVSVDRMERGMGTGSALTELSNQYGFKTCSIVTLDEIVSFLYNKSVDGNVILNEEIFNRISEYREMYGIHE